MGESLDANQIAALLQPGDSRSYHDTGGSAQQLTAEYKSRTESYNRALGRLKSAWTGDSSDAAATSLSALQEAGTVSAENLHNVSMQMNTQAESFSDVKNKVGSGPGPQPEQTFAGEYFPMFTDNDEQIDAWNEKAQQVVDAYNTYSAGTSENAGAFPSTYGELTGDPKELKFTVEKSDTGGTGQVGSPSGGSGSTGTSAYGGGGTGAGSGLGGIGTGGAGSGSTSPSAGGMQPGGSTGVAPGLPPGAIRLPDGSIQYPDGTIRTPDGRIIPPGGTRASSRGFGPGGRDSSFGPGGGASSGAGPGGMGAKVPGGMGAGGMGRGMGMGGMMGGAGAGRGGGGGDDEKEHKDEYYIKQEMDPGLKTEIDEYGEKLVDESTGMTVVPPVIGE